MKKKRVYYVRNKDLMNEILKSKEKLTTLQEKYPDEDYKILASQSLTPELVKYLTLVVENYAKKSNWRGYTWLDDMKAEAVLILITGILKFDTEREKPNPLAYITRCIQRSFINTVNREKAVGRIKDRVSEENGMTPSNGRMVEYEMEMDSRHDRNH